MYVVLSVLVVFGVLCASEIGWRKGWLKNEVGRKFVHILVGSFVAFWPFFLSWNEIRLLSLAFVAVVLVSLRLKVFRAIGSVQRPTYGELCFAAIVGLLTFITHSKGIYAAALLQMSLADGFAAIVGTRFGHGNTYRIFDHCKSVIGTAVFIITSLALLIGYSVCSVSGLSATAIAAGALGAAVIENIVPFGFDNLAVPLFIGVLLTVM